MAADWQWLADGDLTRRTCIPASAPPPHGIGQLEHRIRVLAAVLRARRLATTVVITEILNCHRTYLTVVPTERPNSSHVTTSTSPRSRAPRPAPASSCRLASTQPGNIKPDSCFRTGSGQTGARPSRPPRLNWPFCAETCAMAASCSGSSY